MKLQVIVYDNKPIIKCPFEGWNIGSKGCSECQHFREPVSNKFVECKKADELISMLQKLEYKEK